MYFFTGKHRHKPNRGGFVQNLLNLKCKEGAQAELCVRLVASEPISKHDEAQTTKVKLKTEHSQNIWAKRCLTHHTVCHTAF